jgi:hypothetical protein
VIEPTRDKSFADSRPCETVITDPGRYILEDDFNCGPNEVGIVVNGESDVNIDCQGHTIRGDKDAPGSFGISVENSAADVTMANCKVLCFLDGLHGDI